jgi:transposase
MQGRSYPPEFKLKVVKAVLENQKSVAQLCREHSNSDSLIHTWKKLYRETGEAAFRAVTQAHARSEPLSAEQQKLWYCQVKFFEKTIGEMSLFKAL